LRIEVGRKEIKDGVRKKALFVVHRVWTYK